ncbi:MAG: hypothetical protein EZS28_015526 [Streblomastix strix]|uniref:U-box domain-containing protein n=1 Tax=Streblomastix strix TaxID=222440 RepID=A0A5J4W2B6_9EUKA|nr:MAG: hypothetical protein EZS28_015526 [Streblomastix strix]
MKLFDQILRGKVILWSTYIVKNYANYAQLKLFPSDEQTLYDGILHFTEQTKPDDCNPGKQIWITAKIIKMGRLLSDLEFDAIQQNSQIKPDLTITYARVKEIFNPKAKEIADWMYQWWGNASFSFIAKVLMLNEMKEDENYCAQLTLEVIQPNHDNESQPVFMFMTKADRYKLPYIVQHKINPIEFTAQPLYRQNKQHWFTFVKIIQVFNNDFKPQTLPFNQIPSVAQEQQQKQIKPQTNNTAGQSKWQNVELTAGNQMAPIQNQFGQMPINQGMSQIGGMPNVAKNQFMPQQIQGQFQQTAFQQQQQQQFQSPQSPFNPAIQSQFIQRVQVGGGFNPDPQLKAPAVSIPKMKLLSPAEEASKHYICEFSNSIMTDPVSIDGHYYQRGDLVQYIQDQGISPVSYEAVTISDIKEEPQLKAEIQQYLIDNPGRLNKK